MAKKKDVVPVFVDNVEALEAKMQAMREASENLCHLYTGAG